MRRLAPAFLGLLVAATLVACTPSPSPTPRRTPTPSETNASTPTPTPSPTSTPTPPSTPEADGAAVVVVGSTGFDVVNNAGDLVLSHEWGDEAAPAVEALSRTFMSDPVISEREGDGSHFPDYRLYTWPGFEFRDAIGIEADRRKEYGASSGLDIDVAAVNGVQVMTDAGLAVGSSFDDVRAAGVEDEQPSSGGTAFLLACPKPTGDTFCTLSVGGSDASGVLEYLYVPSAWGL